MTNFSLSGMTLDYKVIIWNFMVLYPNKLQPDKAGQASPVFRLMGNRAAGRKVGINCSNL